MVEHGQAGWSASASLAGLKIVLVEPINLVALDSQAGLMEAGASSVDIVVTNAEAVARMRSGAVDAAIVDIDLGCPSGIAVADEMAETGIPLVFATGYGQTALLPARLAAIPFVAKPYLLQDLIAALMTVVQRRTADE